MTKKYLDELTFEIIGAAIKVHKALGPGLLESIYHKCLSFELEMRNISFVSEIKVPIYYEGIELKSQLKCDLFVDNCIVLELKSVEEIRPVFKAQLLTYMKLLSAPKGILINFNSLNLFDHGQATFVNELFRRLPDK
jgi:GxxExxY protein